MKIRMSRKMLWTLALPMMVAAACVLQPVTAGAQMTSVGVDCSQIGVQGTLMQDNMRAGRVLIECGIIPGGRKVKSHEAPLAPPNVQASNRNCTSGSSCTKSENMVWASTKDNGKTIVVTFNDDNPGNGSNYSGVAYSLDGGVTFTQISPSPFATGHGTNFGDPIVVFNSKLNRFFAGFLATGCGGQGIGMWSSKKPNKKWKLIACAHNGGGDDRESMWVDNEPTSGTYGRMYISFNDFVNNGALSVVYSDNGTSWSRPVVVNAGFIRDVQITGSPRGAARFEGNNSTVFLAAMDEGSGGASTRQNVMYKSLDGGNTWTSATLGPRFNPVGDSACPSNSYFERVNPIWRHMGWGQPAVGPSGVVHYAYAGQGSKTGDTGDIYYVRSTDNGKTWSKPIQLNTDAGGKFKTQWMPSVSSDQNGKVTIAWYDRRAATSACNNVSDPGCNYEVVGVQSADNGATFGSAITISTQIIPQPAQTDPNIQSCYAGDYDYNTALNGNAYVTWTDGRVSVGGTQVQNVDFAAVPLP